MDHQRVSPRIVDKDLVTPDEPSAPAVTNWFTSMSMNKKIAFCMITAIVVIFVLVLIMRYYNSQPKVVLVQPTPPAQTQPAPTQPAQPPPTQPAQPAQPTPDPQSASNEQSETAPITKSDALQALEAATLSETVIGKPVAEIEQFMSEAPNVTEIEETNCDAITSSGKQCKNAAKLNGKCHVHST
jgi:hypothetical protein